MSSLSKGSPYLTGLSAYLRAHPEVVCVSCGDDTLSRLEERMSELPSGLIALPNTPSAAVAFCAGLAREGFRPLLHMSAAALSRGAYEVILSQLAAPCLPMVLVGLEAGLAREGGLGAQAIDDLSLMGGLPNMCVLEPGDAVELEGALERVHDLKGPVYLRATTQRAPVLFEGAEDLGELKALGRGDELLVVSAGRLSAEVLRVSSALKEARVGVTHLHLSQLAPFPSEIIRERLSEGHFQAVICLEEQLGAGLLSRGLSRLLCGLGELKSAPPMVELSLHQSFAQGGRRSYLLRKYGLDAGALISAVERALKRRLGVIISELPPSAWPDEPSP